jgi:hypothetical protein
MLSRRVPHESGRIFDDNSINPFFGSFPPRDKNGIIAVGNFVPCR